MTWERAGSRVTLRRLGIAGASIGIHAMVLLALCLVLWRAPRSGHGGQSSIVQIQLIGPASNGGAPAVSADSRSAAVSAPAPAAEAAATSVTKPAIQSAVAAASTEPAPSPAADTETAGGLANQLALIYQAQLLAHLQRFRTYPDAARAQRLTGKGTVRFAMQRDGKVLEVWVDQGSGQQILDDAAKSMVLRAQPLPPIPAGLPSSLTLSLPFDFSPPKEV